MTSDSWYKVVGAEARLTQGDIILNCPIIRWSSESIELNFEQENEVLKSAFEAIESDVIVMTQACDLENNKVKNVILCPHYSLEDYRNGWEEAMKEKGQTKTGKLWSKHCDDIKNGYIWNRAILNEGAVGDLTIAHRIVDFSEIYTLPRTFLESFLQSRNESRFRLCSPYREHLSQAFAKFFMRVGLPTGVTKVW